ncbi:MAG: hypothetical protein PHC56_09820 [Herbinix sp.]|nr:hypothetical protein [Herbinix sp.]
MKEKKKFDKYIALLLVLILILGGCTSKNLSDASDANTSTDIPEITLSKDTSIEELLA